LIPFRYVLKWIEKAEDRLLGGVMKVRIPVFISCFLFIFVTSPSFSQSPGMGMRNWRGEAPCWRASDLDLSQEQRKNLELIQQAYFREAQLLRAQLFTRRLELREILTSPTTKTEAIRAKSSEIIELQAKEEERSVEYLVKVRNLLTPEQLRKWCPEREFPAFRHRMHGPGSMGPMQHRENFPPPE
jgi:Spy/CpxP family protein refolding chaperone